MDQKSNVNLLLNNQHIVALTGSLGYVLYLQFGLKTIKNISTFLVTWLISFIIFDLFYYIAKLFL